MVDFGAGGLGILDVSCSSAATMVASSSLRSVRIDRDLSGCEK